MTSDLTQEEIQAIREQFMKENAAISMFSNKALRHILDDIRNEPARIDWRLVAISLILKIRRLRKQRDSVNEYWERRFNEYRHAQRWDCPVGIIIGILSTLLATYFFTK